MYTQYYNNTKNNNKSPNTPKITNLKSRNFNTTISKTTSKHKITKIKLNNSPKNTKTINEKSKSSKKSSLPPIRTFQQIVKEIENRKPKEIGSLFLFNKSQKRRKQNKFLYSNNILQTEVEKVDPEEIRTFNVFSSEDKEIKDLMLQLEKNNKNKLLPKLTRKRRILNKLYGLTPTIKTKLTNARHHKNLSLDTYQENILYSIDDDFIEQSNVMDLMQSFDELKLQSDSVKPLPPINVDIIYEHVLNKPQNIKPKNFNLKDYLNNVCDEPMDDFEKEQKLINNIKNYNFFPKKKRNKNLEKMPLFIREVFAKQYH